MGLIRFLLALAVAVTHISQTTILMGSNAVLAVECFYVISGFLIAGAWDNKYSQDARPVFSFYFNRAARIYIMYWAVLLLALVVGVIYWVNVGKWPQYMIVVPGAPFEFLTFQIVSNLTLIGSSVALWMGSTLDGVLYFTNNFASSPFPVWRLLTISPAWTLELELWFYLLAPFLLRLSAKWIVVIAAATFALRFGWYQMGNNADPWTYRFFPFELGVFLLGAIAFKLTKQVDWSKWRIASFVVFITVALSVAFYVPAILAEARFAYLAIFAASLPIIFNLTKDWPVDRFLADLSFPLYLVHWPVLLITYNLPKPIPYWQGMVPTLLSIVLAVVLAVLVERPIDRWRHSRMLKRRQFRQPLPA